MAHIVPALDCICALSSHCGADFTVCGTGGLLIVPAELDWVARRSVCYGYDSTKPAAERMYDARASNWKMADFSAAAVVSTQEVQPW